MRISLADMTFPVTRFGDVRVLAETDHFFVLYKPAGIHSVGLAKGGAPSIAAALVEACPPLAEIAPKREDGALVHRLDAMTSGVLVGAKSRETWEFFHRQFQNGSAEKLYLALIEGRLRQTERVTAWLGSRYRGSKKVTVREMSSSVPPPRFEASESVFEPLQAGKRDAVTLVRVALRTGGRHQVRAHAAFIGHPLVGDSLYGASMRNPKELPDFLLHCESIRLRLSSKDNYQTFSAPLPDYWKAFELL